MSARTPTAPLARFKFRLSGRGSTSAGASTRWLWPYGASAGVLLALLVRKTRSRDPVGTVPVRAVNPKQLTLWITHAVAKLSTGGICPRGSSATSSHVLQLPRSGLGCTTAKKAPAQGRGKEDSGDLGTAPSYIRRSINVDTHHVHGRVVSLHQPNGHIGRARRRARSPGPHAGGRQRSTATANFTCRSAHYTNTATIIGGISAGACNSSPTFGTDAAREGG
jgi:hypothetical protein